MKRLIPLLLSILLLFSSAAAESAAALDELYKSAELLMVQGDYTGAAAKFDAMGSYSDASQMAMYCKAIAAAESLGLYSVAVDAFGSLGEFKDSPQMAIYYTARSYQAIAENCSVTTDTDEVLKGAYANYQTAVDLYNQQILFKDSMTRSAACAQGQSTITAELNQRSLARTEIVYQDAIALENAGSYQEAMAKFESIRDYKDASEHITACQDALWGQDYDQALALETEGRYEEAISAYWPIRHYKDSEQRIADCEFAIKEDVYQRAAAAEQQGDYESAISLYQTILDHKDSKQRIADCEFAILDEVYQRAAAAEQQGDYENAISLYQSIPDHRDSTTRAMECRFILSVQLEEDGKYDAASSAFYEISRSYRYNDCMAHISTCKLRTLDTIGEFRDGVASVRFKDWTGGAINEQGEILFTKDYELLDFYEGYARLIPADAQKYPRIGVVDAAGREISLPGTATTTSNRVSNGMIAVKGGYCNVKNGSVIKVDTGYVIPSFSDGLLCVPGKNDKFGYIDTDGKQVIKAQFTYRGDFNEGYAVTSKQTGNNRQFIVIDKTGKTVLTIKKGYGRTAQYLGMSGVHDGLIMVARKEKLGFMNLQGELVVDCIYDKAGDFHNGLAWVMKDGKLGYINTAGEEVIPLQWDERNSDFMPCGLAIVAQGDTLGLINRQGDIVLEPGKYRIVYSEGSVVPVHMNGAWYLLDGQGRIVR